MENFYDDMYLWKTILTVCGEPRPDIYEKLYGKCWTIKQIEELM